MARLLGLAIGAAALAWGAFLLLPLAGLFTHAGGPGLAESLGQPHVAAALRLSLWTSALATVAVVAGGLPVAYLLHRRRFPGREAILTLLDLPTVLPPVVSGLALLLAFGRMGLVGRHLALFGVSIPFSTTAVIMAQAFVASPFFINAARAGLAAVEPQYLLAAATLRAGEMYRLWRVSLPLAAPSLIAGAAMAWARALGEFGATIMFAGNLPGVTQTMPLAVYLAAQTDLGGAVTLSILLVIFSFTCLLILRTAAPGRAL